MGVLAVMAVGGCGAGRSERTRAIPPLRASAAPCDPFLPAGGVRGYRGPSLPWPLRERSQPGSSARSHPKRGAIGAVLSDRKVPKGR